MSSNNKAQVSKYDMDLPDHEALESEIFQKGMSQLYEGHIACKYMLYYDKYMAYMSCMPYYNNCHIMTIAAIVNKNI